MSINKEQFSNIHVYHGILFGRSALVCDLRLVTKKIMNQVLNISRNLYVHMRKIDILDLERVLL